MIKKTIAAAAAIGVALTAFAGIADARPGKPGDNALAPGGNIVEVAVAANDALGVFNTVLTAATCDYFDGAVVAILAGDSKVTLFAPTDAAFAALGLNAANVCSTFADTPEALLNILAYHVTDGRRFSNSVFGLRAKRITMLNGGTVVANPDLTLTGAGNEDPVGIVAPFFDINARNGVIHVIDTVLLP
jgi:uncharacterized surface protein with fasciclin (FAS1) repeats